MKKPIILFFTLIIIATISFLYISSQSCKAINCLNITDLNDYKVKSIDENSKSIFRAVYSNDSDILRINITSDVDPSRAIQYINADITRSKELFSDAPAPYPGLVSDRIVCDKEFVPKFYKEKINNTEISYFIGYLSKGMAFGACTESEAYYKGVSSIFYCEDQKKLYNLEFISQKDNFDQKKYEELLHAISCK